MEVETWKNFMNSQMFNWPQIPLEKDKDGKFIPDGLDENGKQKYKHLKYKEDQVDLKTGQVLHKKGEDVVVLKQLQAVLRPIQLYEYIIPEESLPEVLGMMNIHEADNINLRPEMKPIAWSLRKLMHLNKVPIIPQLQGKQPYEISTRFIPTRTVATYPIGIKKDPRKDYLFTEVNGEKQGYYQEGI